MRRLKDLLVVLPGMGGSVLTSESGLVWGDESRVLEAVNHPEPLNPDRELIPVGLIGTLTLVPGWVLWEGYEGLVHGIHDVFDNVVLDEGDPSKANWNANVVLAPYDFRRSIRDSAAALDYNIRRRLKLIGGSSSATHRVLVVAHSMGGLVARYWLGPLEGWRVCRALITLGTPHRGAPKALDVLVNGVRQGPVRLSQFSKILRSWPGMHELLPRYPVITVPAAGMEVYPHEVASELGLNDDLARAAFETHKDIETAWQSVPPPPEGPAVIPLVGTRHPTVASARWDGSHLVCGKTALPKHRPDLQGDGTVPGLSAIPIEMTNLPGAWRDVPYRHSQIASAIEALRLVGQYSEDPPSGDRGIEPATDTAPRLGLDLEECYEAGAPATIRVHAMGPCDNLTQPRASLSQAWPSAHALGELNLERTGTTEWKAALGGLSEGMYRVRVSLRGQPWSRDANDVFAVLA
ncbi:MAG: hypothetical protein AB7O37_18190 [Vicinamibacteria bacterium]